MELNKNFGAKIAQRSYINPLDKAFEQLKFERNFSPRLWEDSIKNSQQNVLAALLEQNKGKTMRDEFYDPNYYDYDRMMTELYKDTLDDNIENAIERKVTYTNEKGEQQEYSFGKMTDRQWAYKQLEDSYAARKQEIELSLEQKRKDEMGWLEKTWNNIVATTSELLEGAATGIAGILDVGFSPFTASFKAADKEFKDGRWFSGLLYFLGGPVAGLIVDGATNNASYLDSFVESFGEGLTALEKENLRVALDEWERKNTDFKTITGETTTVGQWVGGIANSIGMMIPSMVMTAVGIPGGTFAFYGAMFSERLYENAVNPYTKNSPSWLKITNAAVTTAVEYVIEAGLNKIWGSTFANRLLGYKGGIKTKIATDSLTKSGLKILTKDAIQEGIEEVCQDLSTALINKATDLFWQGSSSDGSYGKNFNEEVSNLWMSFVMGAATSIILTSATGGIETFSKLTLEKTINRRLSKGSLIEMPDGTIVDAVTKEKKYDSKYIAERIEKDGKSKVLSGFSRLAFTNLINDFSEKVNNIKNIKNVDERISATKDIYIAFKELQNLYSSFSMKQVNKAQETITKAFELEERDKSLDVDFNNYINTLKEQTSIMIAGSPARLSIKKDVEKAIDKVNEELKKSKTSEIKAIHNKNDNKEIKKAIKEAEALLKTNPESMFDEYENIVITNGNYAIENENTIFVPETWLENFDKTAIYKFLKQESILNNILNEPKFKEFNDEILKSFKEFTGNKNATNEEALTQFLFNKTVFQNFLLSTVNSKAKIKVSNAIKFKDFIFNMYNYIDLMTENVKGNYNKNLLKQVKEQIKQTERIPMIKAILHWNLNPQEIGADAVLNENDLNFIKKYQMRTLALSNPVNNRALLPISNLKNSSYFTFEEKRFIDKAMSDNATLKERLQATIMLQLADVEMRDKMKYSSSLVGSLTIPKQALADFSPNETGFITDAIRDFERIYSFSLQDLCDARNELNTSYYLAYLKNNKEIQNLLADKNVNIDTLSLSDIKYYLFTALESMLGDKYIVLETNSNGYEVFKALPGIDILPKSILNPIGNITREESFKNMFMQIDNIPTRDLLSFINIDSKWLYNNLKDWNVIIDNESATPKCDIPNKTIVLKDEVDILHAFIHELNHAIHYYSDVEFSASYSTMKRLKVNFAETFLELTRFYKTLYNRKRLSQQDITFLLYKMNQSELLAELYEHDKVAKGWTLDNIKEFGIILKENEKVNKDKILFIDKLNNRMTPKQRIDQIQAENALVDTYYNMLDAVVFGRENENKSTYHSRLTKYSAKALTNSILNEQLPLLDKALADINTVITNAKEYLSPDILTEIQKQGRYINNEGDIYNYLKQYFENEYNGISIDRDYISNKYIFVDDNAFDDLISPKYNKDTKITKLSDIYDENVLKQLGIPTTIEIKIGNEANQFVRDEDHPGGIIYINSNTENIVRAINHEFRHLMQYYNNLESGFTVDFKATKEMVEDIKAHIPQIFKAEITRAYAEGYLRSYNEKNFVNKEITEEEIDNFIARSFVYFMTNGEQNAYGMDAAFIRNKPVYVKYDGPKPVIFMPWYDGKDVGRYKTDFIANLYKATNNFPQDVKDKIPTNKFVYQGNYGRNKGSRIAGYDKSTKRYDKSYYAKRHFTLKEAKGTNLEYFYKPGKQNSMDPKLQEFIKATPKDLSELGSFELKKAIENGTLTKQKLYNWIRKVDKIKEETFQLINDTMFHNSSIKSFKELEMLTSTELQLWWATAIVYANAGLDIEGLMKDKTVSELKYLMDNLQNSSNEYIKKNIAKAVEGFSKRYDKETKTLIEMSPSEELENYMRVGALQFFDGSISSMFYIGNLLRQLMFEYQNEISAESLDTSIKGGKIDSDETTVLEKISNEMSENITPLNIEKYIKGFKLSDTTNLFKLYENTPDVVDENLSRTQKEEQLLFNQIQKAIKEKGATEAQIRKALPALKQKLENMTDEQINLHYNRMIGSELFGIETKVDVSNAPETFGSKLRTDYVAKVKRAANKITRYISKANWKNLPADVKSMFDGKGSDAKLKEEYIKTGYGGPKAQDISKIVQAADKLLTIAEDAKKGVYNQDNTSLATEYKKLRKKFDIQTKSLLSKTVNSTSTNANIKETKIKIDSKKRTSDTPNEFTIYSPIAMPDIVKELFDTSFNRFADTRVQYISRDTDGNLYTKDSPEFKAQIEHEMVNAEAFYEANRETLNNLTKEEVSDIVEFILSGANTLDGPSNKLFAIEIFTMGYLVDGARNGLWQMSDSEKSLIESTYEKLASEAGSGLSAVSQMIKVINPLRKVKQLMLERYNLSSDEAQKITDNMIEATDKLQRAKTKDEKDDAAKLIQKEISNIEATLLKHVPKKSIWQKIKSIRVLNMLSAPTTWIRNAVSNIIVKTFNSASEVLGKFANLTFNKKYRSEQWDLTGTQISEEVKTFIDNNIKNSPLFEYMYDESTKYDERAKLGKQQKELFVLMIVKAVETKFAAEHRFDTNVMNVISRFVSRMISDKRFIKSAALKYLGKILTIETNKKNISLNNGLSTQVLNLFAESVILASQDYMHKRSFLADMIDRTKADHPYVYEVLTTWQPFLNSGFNWFAEMLKYTPAGLIKSVFDYSKLERKIAKMDDDKASGKLVSDSRAAQFLVSRDIGRGILGTILMTAGILCAVSGLLKIKRDDDNDKWLLTAGNIDIDISEIFGSSSFLIGVSMAQIGKESFVDIMREVTASFARGFIVADLLERYKYLDGPYDLLLTETESFMKSFVPNILQQFTRATNNQKIKYDRSFKGPFVRWLDSWLPGQPLSERQINPYTGEPYSKYSLPFIGEYLKSGILGPKILLNSISKEEELARSYGVNKGMLTGELKANNKEYKLDKNILNKKYGELNKKTLATLPTSNTRYKVQASNGKYVEKTFDDMTDEQKSNVIERLMNTNALYAKIYTWTLSGHKYYTDKEEYRTLKSLGITTNIYLGDKGFVE